MYLMYHLEQSMHSEPQVLTLQSWLLIVSVRIRLQLAWCATSDIQNNAYGDGKDTDCWRSINYGSKRGDHLHQLLWQICDLVDLGSQPGKAKHCTAGPRLTRLTTLSGYVIRGFLHWHCCQGSYYSYDRSFLRSLHAQLEAHQSSALPAIVIKFCFLNTIASASVTISISCLFWKL